MYERQIEVLGQICSRVFQGMTSTEVVHVTCKRDQRSDARYTVAFHIKYENLEKRIEGKFTLGFTEPEMAVAVAAPLAETLGLTPPAELDETTVELLSEFLNTVVGHAVAAWDKIGFKVRFFPPEVCREVPLRHPAEIESEAYVIILALDVHHVTFRVAFSDELASDLRGKRLLVVDDSGVIRKVVASHLRNAGFEVEEAKDGREAVEKHASFKPHLTVMDQVMPNLNGLDAILEINEATPGAKFIMLTSTSRKDEVLTARTLGVVEYLLKPLDLNRLLGSIANALTKQDQELRPSGPPHGTN